MAEGGGGRLHRLQPGRLYAKRWTDAAGATRYTADPHEISLVDLPCLAEARFEMVKADGSHEWRRFQALDLDKVGARNNAEDQDRIQAMHDTSVALGACCPAIKVSSGGDLSKVGDDLAKRLDRLGETLSGALADVSKRLAAIEAQPQPLPFSGQPRAVAKHEDGADGLDALLADPATLSLLAIKLAQRNQR